jgi:hypothetical protein
MAALELDIDLFPGILDTVSQAYQQVISPNNPDNGQS